MNNGEILEQKMGKMVVENHLGGFIDGGDIGTYYPTMWDALIHKYNIKSVVDIGCGRGYSTKYFKSLGCDVLGIDGSTQAKELTIIPENFLLNDYTISDARIKNFDLAWSCEFLEHVEEKYQENYMKDFQQCKYAAVTFAGPNQWGHHHVNCNTQEYWIDIFKKYNFKFLSKDTEKLRNLSHLHFKERGLFFINE